MAQAAAARLDEGGGGWRVGDLHFDDIVRDCATASAGGQHKHTFSDGSALISNAAYWDTALVPALAGCYCGARAKGHHPDCPHAEGSQC
jgi:hypothetical protein